MATQINLLPTPAEELRFKWEVVDVPDAYYA